MSVTCWYCDVRELLDPVRFSRGMSLLPWEERREKVMRFHFEIDRCRCLGAGLLLANALREAGVADMTLRTLPNGKPVLVHEPDIHFNLSHSGNLAVCAVSDHPVGVDVEVLQNVDPRVAGMCFQPVERIWIADAEDPARAFTRLWTRKESFLKLSGDGLSRPLTSFCVLPGQDAANGVWYAEKEETGHRICVCIRQRDVVTFKQEVFRNMQEQKV